MTSIPRFAADASAHDIAGALTTAGAAIIERLVPGSLVDELLGQMHPFIEATPLGGDDFVGRRTKRTGALLARSVASRQFIAHPLVLGALMTSGVPTHSVQSSRGLEFLRGVVVNTARSPTTTETMAPTANYSEVELRSIYVAITRFRDRLVVIEATATE